MLIKIILALAIACMFMGGIGAAGGITGLKTAIADKQTVSNSAMLDKAIVNWYTAHDYELPESLSKEMLAIMGLHDIDLSKFTYTKLSDNKFRLVANLSGKKTETSINSNRDLPLKPSQNAPSNIGGVNNGSTSSSGTEAKPDGSTNGGTTVPDTGESGSSSGGSGTTVGGGSGSTTTPDSSESGGSSSTNSPSGDKVTAPDAFGLECLEKDGNPATSETTVDFGNGAEYIITLYHVLPAHENEDNPDTVSCVAFLSGKMTFALYKNDSASLYDKTNNKCLLDISGFAHSSYWVTFEKKS